MLGYFFERQAREAAEQRSISTSEASNIAADFLSPCIPAQAPGTDKPASNASAQACGQDKKAMYSTLLFLRRAARITFLATMGAFVLSCFVNSHFLSMAVILTAMAGICFRIAAIKKEVSHG